jgi:hypothetical protein
MKRTIQKRKFKMLRTKRDAGTRKNEQNSAKLRRHTIQQRRANKPVAAVPENIGPCLNKEIRTMQLLNAPKKQVSLRKTQIWYPTYFNYFGATEELKDAATHEVKDGRKPKIKTDSPESMQNNIAPLLAKVLRSNVCIAEKCAANASARIQAVA